MGQVNLHPETLARFRKELHQYPELSGKETETAKRIVAFLRESHPDQVLEGIGKTGVAVLFNGKKDGPTVLFRCELDALPIAETNTFEHRSIHNGVSHKCGHDGHMAILCGLAFKLAAHRPQKGRVVLLFQPAEENGSGAAKVLADPLFQSVIPDYVFALHNLPGFEAGQWQVKEGTFSCAVNSLIIKLTGKTAHAGEPQNGKNPAMATAEILTAFQSRVQTDIGSTDFCLITPIYARIGSRAYGVSAGAGELHFTVRCNSNARMESVEKQLEDQARQIARAHGLSSKLRWTQPFKATENATEATAILRQAAQSQNLPMAERKLPFSWGEDFGLFTQSYQGAMAGLGAGKNTAALHNPDYDFPDEIIDGGVALFYQICKDLNDA